MAIHAFASPGWAQINNYGLLTGINTIPGNAVEFDTRSNAPIGSTIVTGGAPINAIFSPDGRFAYTANVNGNSVSVVDVLSRNVVATIPVAFGPAALALSANGQFLYTANQSNDTVSVINTATNLVVGAPIVVGASPVGVAISPDGNTLYVTNAVGGNVSVVDVTTRAVIATVGAGLNPYGVVTTPDGTKVYVANESSNTVSVINTATNTVIATVPAFNLPLGVAMSPDGTRVAVATNGTTTIINTATNTVVATVFVGGTAIGAAYTPDGSRLYVTVTNGAVIIDPSTNTIVGSVSAPALGNGNIGTAFIGPNIIEAPGGSLSVASDAALTGLGFGQFVNFNGGTLRAAAGFSTARTISLLAGGGTIDTNGVNVTVSGQIINSGGLTKVGAGTLTLSGANTYNGGTTFNGGTVAVSADNNLGDAAGGLTFNGGALQTTSTFVSNRAVTLNAAGGIFNTDTLTSLELSGNIGGTGGLTKTGGGTLILGGNNVYSGGTTVSAGILQGNTTSLQGNIVNNAQVTFNQATAGTYAGTMSGTGGLLVNGTGTVILTGANSYTGGTTVSGGVLQGNTTSLPGNILNNASVVFNQTSSGTYAGAMSGTGGMTLQGGGTLAVTGNSTYTGATTVNASTLLVNGSLTSAVSLTNGGILGGSGSIGTLVANGGIVAPGNSIGTLTVNGSFVQNGGTYQVEANAAGQADRVNVAGSATINGASVQVIAAPGNYGASTTYTILNATGGVSGTYSGVSSNFAFLTPSLTYNANNVFLTLALQGNAFSGFGGNTTNQRAVGYALDQSFANAAGDFATVIGALAGLSTTQGPLALNTISGQPYADFGTVNVQGASLFMNAVGQQMALARGGAGSGQRQALAQACEVEACEGASPWSVWASALGGLGSVAGNGNSSTLTYNFGGGAAGIDYRLDPRFLVGIGAGYTHGTQWVDSFMGKGWTDAVSVTAYGSFTQAGFYADALAGYGYSNNQLQRQISIPGLQPRTANGSTGANQFLGQVETGYKIPVFAAAQATVTPFGRLLVNSVNQAAFSEWGANSLSLNVAQQTTNSLRSTFGADLAGAIVFSDTRTLALALRLGWQHEFADTGRPITAAFAGAPTASFTVFGATPQRDSAVIGFSAATAIASNAQLYLRYDGEVGGGTDNHALNLGVRLSW